MIIKPLDTLFFFFNDTATTEIYTLSLHDALPIYRELAEQTPHDAPHHQDGNKDSDERSTHGENGEADFAGALHGGGEGFHAVFDVAGGGFYYHDGIVHDQSRCGGGRHERQNVVAL